MRLGRIMRLTPEGGNRKRTSTSRRDRTSSKRARRPWSGRRIAIVASAAVLVGGMAYALPTASRWGRDGGSFTLDRIDVVGNVVLTAQEIVALSGVEMGTNLVSIDARSMETLLAAHPRVLRVSATVSLPNRLAIRIEEKLPVLLMASGGGCVEAAADGTVLPPAARTGRVDLPLVTGIAGTPEPGERFDSPELDLAIDLLERTCSVSPGLWAEISEIRIAPESGLLLYTVADGAEIRLGSGAVDDSDLNRLWAVLSNLRANGDVVESIDLRFSDQAVVRIDRTARRARV